MNPLFTITLDVYKDAVDIRHQAKENLSDKERRRLMELKEKILKLAKEAKQLELI